MDNVAILGGVAAIIAAVLLVRYIRRRRAMERRARRRKRRIAREHAWNRVFGRRPRRLTHRLADDPTADQ